jgi:hypothetical protein
MAASPNEDEAAAIAAALERFLAETAVAVGAEAASIPPWQRAALIEGVGAKGGLGDLEGGERWRS